MELPSAPAPGFSSFQRSPQCDHLVQAPRVLFRSCWLPWGHCEQCPRPCFPAGAWAVVCTLRSLSLWLADDLARVSFQKLHPCVPVTGAGHMVVPRWPQACRVHLSGFLPIPRTSLFLPQQLTVAAGPELTLGPCLCLLLLCPRTRPCGPPTGRAWRGPSPECSDEHISGLEPVRQLPPTNAMES